VKRLAVMMKRMARKLAVTMRIWKKLVVTQRMGMKLAVMQRKLTAVMTMKMPVMQRQMMMMETTPVMLVQEIIRINPATGAMRRDTSHRNAKSPEYATTVRSQDIFLPIALNPRIPAI